MKVEEAASQILVEGIVKRYEIKFKTKCPDWDAFFESIEDACDLVSGDEKRLIVKTPLSLDVMREIVEDMRGKKFATVTEYN